MWPGCYRWTRLGSFSDIPDRCFWKVAPPLSVAPFPFSTTIRKAGVSINEYSLSCPQAEKLSELLSFLPYGHSDEGMIVDGDFN